MNGLRNRLLKRFRNRDYRHSYVESFLNSLISTQIRLLRERKNLSQEELGGLIGTTQSGISRIENPNYSSWRIDTLRKLARAFDMCLSVKFVSFGDAVGDVVGFRENRLIRPEFESDPEFKRAPVIRFRGPEVKAEATAEGSGLNVKRNEVQRA